MLKKRRFVFFTWCVCVGWMPILGAVAQNDSGGSASSEQSPEEEIRSQLRRYVVAFNDRNFDQIADIVSPDIQYRDESAELQINDAAAFIERLKSAIVNEPTLKLEAQSNEVRMDNGTTATIQGSTKLIAEGVPDENSYFVVRLSNLESLWKITSIVEQSQQAMLQSTASEAIEALAWLVGTWQDSSPEELHSEIEFLPGGQFLRRTITEPSSKHVLGFEIIGYDPILNRVRSWTYFSDGTFGSGYWSGEEDHWSLKVTQTLPDGRTASGTYVLRPQDSDTMTVQMVSREIDGEPMPSGVEVTMKRIAPPQATNDPLRTVKEE